MQAIEHNPRAAIKLRELKAKDFYERGFVIVGSPKTVCEQLLEALKQIKTEDVVVQTVATLVNLAGQKLSVEGAKDPAEAKNAIDAARHMLPLVPEDAKPPIQNALDQIQMMYVRASAGVGPDEPPPPREEPEPPKSKIWTPPGS